MKRNEDRRRGNPGIKAASLAIPFLAAMGTQPAVANVVVETWGINTYGELGNGTTTDSNAPVTVSGLSNNVAVVAGGDNHSLAIQNGGAWAWGLNSNGQLGDGTFNNSTTPVAVSGLSTGVTAIAGGEAWSMAVQNGALWVWGANNFGQLGNGTTTEQGAPIAVSDLSSGVTAISAGGFNSLAIQNGGVWAWGRNEFGQLGDGTTIDRHTPVQVTGLTSGVTAIAAGPNSGLAIQNGGVWTWPTNGRLTPVAVSGLSIGVTAIAAGFDANFAVMGGHVWAWGGNENGQLGDGTQTNRATPEEIDPTDLSNIVAVAAGDSCSYALSSDGSLWVWGSNEFGQLGLGPSTGNFLTPQHLLPPNGYAFTSINIYNDGLHAVTTLTSVPEPANASILAIGAFGLLTRWRRMTSNL